MQRFVRPRNLLFVAAHTPFAENMSLNLAILPKYVDYLVKYGVEGVYINGTTGEFSSLNQDERKKSQEAWIKAISGKMEPMAHVGTANLEDTIDLAKHSVALGCKSVAAVPPFYSPPPNVECAMEYMRALSEAVPEAEVYYYHMPSHTKTTFTLLDLLNASKDKVPKLVGAKFTDTDAPQLQRCSFLKMKDGQTFNVMSGFEEYFLANLGLGVRGVVGGGMLNFTPGRLVALRTAFDKGDLDKAQKLQLKLNTINGVVKKYGGFGGMMGARKDATRLMGRREGFDVGPTRPPLRALPADQLAKYEKDLDAAGLFDKDF